MKVQSLVVLDCLLDTCPKVNHSVDWRRCQDCGSYRGQQKIGQVNCCHPDARHEKEKVREGRREAFQACAGGVGHLLYAGRLRGE